MKVTIAGAGLAGCEAAWQLAQRGIQVHLYERKKKIRTEAQDSDLMGELVCSNSFRGRALTQGVGLLKEELLQMDSLFMKAALSTEVPAGGALAVDRQAFSGYLDQAMRSHPLIQVMDEELTDFPAEGLLIIATGPLSDGPLLAKVRNLAGEAFCYFFDGSAPIVAGDSLDYSKLYFATRYGKGNPQDYLNAPLSEEAYGRLYKALLEGRRNIPHLEGEKEKYFEGCMPVEEMARRGEKTLLFGPLKPVGLEDAQGRRAFGVVQLRRENKEGTMYNLVGFQTGLSFPSQKEIIHLIPGLEEAEILRYGVVHRNTYLDSPRLLHPTGAFRKAPDIFVAGQVSGVEGYVESAASGLAVGLAVWSRLERSQELAFPEETMIGALMAYISKEEGDRRLEPMNANFGLLPPLKEEIRDKRLKKEALAARALAVLREFQEGL